MAVGYIVGIYIGAVGDAVGMDVEVDGEKTLGKDLGKAVSGHDPNTVVSDSPKSPPPEATCSIFT